MSPNDADGMANNVDSDQTAWSSLITLIRLLGAVWSGSALFAQAYLSKNLGLLRYFFHENSLLAELLYKMIAFCVQKQQKKMNVVFLFSF